MGAQAAALLDAGGPVGDVPDAAAVPGGSPGDGRPGDGRLTLDVPPGWVLARTALRSGSVGLAPTAWDGARLHLRLPDRVVVEPSGTVRWRGAAPGTAVLRRVLALDDDLEPLWEACDRVPSLRWVRPAGAGRALRAPTVWQDLVGVLAATRTSYRSTQAMVRGLVGTGAFPGPDEVLHRDLTGWGYRGPRLRSLAERVLDGWDPERLLDPRVPDGQVHDEVRSLEGFGPFATAALMPLLGRPRPLVLDGWLRDRLGDERQVRERYAALGRWAGTGAELEAAAGRLRPGPPPTPTSSGDRAATATAVDSGRRG